MAQQPFMLEGSVEDNLKVVSKLNRSDYDRQMAEELLSRLGLTRLDRLTNAASLSGGEAADFSYTGAAASP